MANDGTIKIDTSLDTKMFEAALTKLGEIAKKGFDVVSSAAKTAAGAIEMLLGDKLLEKFSGVETALDTLGTTIIEGFSVPLAAASDEGVDAVNRLISAFKEGGLSGMAEEMGSVFAGLAAKIAENAPAMVSAAAEMIRSFIKGLADNSGKLLKAAGNIAGALADGLISLLPSQVQKPAKQAMDAIFKAFNGAELKKMIGAVGSMFSNMGKLVMEVAGKLLPPLINLATKGVTVVAKGFSALSKIASSVAKVILPPLAKVVDVVADNLDILVPLIIGAVAAFKTFQIVTTVRNAIKLFQAAIIGLEGGTKLVTAAQWLWNAAMAANPIGIVIIAVAALAAGIAVLCSQQDEEISNEEELAKKQEALAQKEEELRQKKEALKKSIEDTAQAVEDFWSRVDSASNVLDNFNTSIIMSQEKQDELSKSMSDVQDEITEISTTAVSQRRSLTEQEVQRLDELFEKMHELAAQELEFQKGMQDVALERATILSETHQGTLAEYQEQAEALIKTAEDTRDGVVEKAEEQYNNEIALAMQNLKNKEGYSQQDYDNTLAAAKKNYDAAVAAADKQQGETNRILADGMFKYSTTLQNANKEFERIQEEDKQAQEKHYKEKIAIEDDYNQNIKAKKKKYIDMGFFDAAAANQVEIDKKKELKKSETDLEEVTNRNLKKLQDMANDEKLRDDTIAWGSMLGMAQVKGAKLTTENETTYSNVMRVWSECGSDATAIGESIGQGMIDGLANKEKALTEKAEAMGGGVFGILRRYFGIASPSKVMKKLFGYVWEGAEIATDKGAEKLIKQGEKTAVDFISKTKKAINKADLAVRMRAAVSAGQAKISGAVSAQVSHLVNLQTPADRSDAEKQKIVLRGTLENHLFFDNRETAIQLTPFISEELAYNGG